MSRVETLERQKRTFDLAMTASQMGTWRYTLADNICVYDENAQRLYGLTEARFLHDEEGAKSKFHPDDLAADVVTGSLRRSIRWGRPLRRGIPGQAARWQLAMAERLGPSRIRRRGRERKPVAIAGASRDLTERKQAEEQQRLLLNELNHRVKNTLATIQAIAAQTLRTARDLPSAKEALERRIHVDGQGS